MAETTIRPAFEAQKLAADCMDSYHEDLLEARILWLFTTAKRTRGGRVVLGTAGRTNALQRFLSSGNESVATGHDYIILISEKRWQTSLATQRAALIDHLLCRCVKREVLNKTTGNMTTSWGTVGPDVEEFTDVILRHGVWLPEQQTFAKAIVAMPGRQLTLHLPDLQDEPEDKPADGGKPADRETTVDEQGTVVGTTRLDDQAEHDRKNTETADLLEHQVAERAATNGIDHEPGWQEQTGIGSSEIEQHRRRRGTRSSETAPTA